MSTANPTPLRVGMAGNLNGIRYRVIGRVVLGMEEDGETYYWNEFNLADDRGQNATLVFEEAEDGPAWKLFMMFEPTRPMTAAEAARQRVGDLVNLDGSPASITLRDQSRVYYIEGRAPEGVEVGDIAEYFNVDDGARMLVVSWTGNEVECFRGMNVPTDRVNAAFGIQTQWSGGGSSRGNAFLGATGREDYAQPSTGISMRTGILVLGVVVLGIAGYMSWEKTKAPHGPRKVRARQSPLPVDGTNVLGHAVIEIAHMAGRYDCHEYKVRAADGAPGLLFFGLTGKSNEWHQLLAFQPDRPLLPRDAGKLGRGDTFADATIETLFQCESSFGFLAHSATDWVFVRWGENQIEFYRGNTIPEAVALANYRR